MKEIARLLLEMTVLALFVSGMVMMAMGATEREPCYDCSITRLG